MATQVDVNPLVAIRLMQAEAAAYEAAHPREILARKIYGVVATALLFTLGVLTLTQGLDPRIIGGAALGLGAINILFYCIGCVKCCKGRGDMKEVQRACGEQCAAAVMMVVFFCLGSYTFNGQMNPNVLGYFGSIAGGIGLTGLFMSHCCGAVKKSCNQARSRGADDTHRPQGGASRGYQPVSGQSSANRPSTTGKPDPQLAGEDDESV